MKDKLRECRERNHYSIQELASFFGSDEKKIIDWESGTSQPIAL